MAKVPLSAEVEADVKKRANVFGVVLGLVCIPTAFLGGMIGACCPLGSFIGIVPIKPHNKPGSASTGVRSMHRALRGLGTNGAPQGFLGHLIER